MSLLPILVAALLLAAIGGGVWLWWREGEGESSPSDPVLVFRMDGEGASPRPPPRKPPELPASRSSPAEPRTPRHRGTPGPRPAARPPSPRVPAPAPDPEYEAPPDGTLQLLPGRFIVETGEEPGRELRFMLLPGQPSEITFGRSKGPENRHFHLDSPAVSRMHARIRFEDGLWALRNLSTTNPTLVNGAPLIGEDEVLLEDGMRVEMGDVVLRFEQVGGPSPAPASEDRPAAPALTRSPKGTKGTMGKRRRSAPEREPGPPAAQEEAADPPPSPPAGAHTERGLRSINQDATLVRAFPDGRFLAAVCDGMGSHGAGGTASRMALEALEKAVEAGVPLEEAVERSNRALREAAERDRALEGMGTTVVALLAEGANYRIANVGDSRAYRVDSRSIRQITRDHSFVAEAIASGEMSSAEARDSPWKHAITRNLGGKDEVEVDLFDREPGSEPHLVVLSSDGVHSSVPDEEIATAVRAAPDLEEAARRLCDQAIRRGSRDNVTAVVIAFG